MTPEIALLLAQDGLTTGAIYALMALALVLVFAVTRVIFVPQGEFLSYGALTLAALQAGTLPGTVWLLLAVGALAFASMDAAGALHRRHPRALLRSGVWILLLPAALAAAAAGLHRAH